MASRKYLKCARATALMIKKEVKGDLVQCIQNKPLYFADSIEEGSKGNYQRALSSPCVGAA